ncbi:MAG TPA: NAD(P)-dependent oxidoreductase [Solirubrobacteraceae bacterium]|jgi:nucleoside-diphosphate-sugar epimerase|nr:NAD(P)-dependent oxidoreductase [Solirubrobacteraceae bacterium]
MKIFLAGASGAVGRSLIPMLREHGHEVVGTTRTPQKADALRKLGAEPVVLDALDRSAVLRAVAAAEPDAIVHQMTALSNLSDFRKFEREFAMTNRLRTEGTDNLLAAAKASGVERVIAQSYAGWPYARTGGPVKTENDPLDSDPPKQMRTTLDAIRHLEQSVTGAGGVVLRYGGFYGPGTGMAPGGSQWETVRARKFPVVGDGGGVWSFTHVEDAATATVAALERWTPGEVYNAVDDEPARVSEWLPALAAAIGAKPPRRIPRWMARPMGAHLVVMMCEVRGASNGKARTKLDWTPRWPTWREGFERLGATKA